ncbi:MAG: endonuclease III [Candidatus Levybacteria bacterium]|nr:endonuclease III [Candidatus Levybacteria bacterium]
MDKKQAKSILSLLKKHYPNASIILKYSNNLELLISVMLSAQTTDIQVNKVTSVLFPKYQKKHGKNLKYYDKYKKIDLSKKELVEIVNFAYCDLKTLEKDIRSIGLYKNKAKNIKASSLMLLKDFKGIIPKSISDLTKLYKIIEGVAVDTHVKRLSLKYGFTKSKNPSIVEKDLMNLFDKKDWFSITYLLIEHGRTIRRLKKDFIVLPKKN